MHNSAQRKQLVLFVSLDVGTVGGRMRKCLIQSR